MPILLDKGWTSTVDQMREIILALICKKNQSSRSAINKHYLHKSARPLKTLQLHVQITSPKLLPWQQFDGSWKKERAAFAVLSFFPLFSQQLLLLWKQNEKRVIKYLIAQVPAGAWKLPCNTRLFKALDWYHSTCAAKINPVFHKSGTTTYIDHRRRDANLTDTWR